MAVSTLFIRSLIFVMVFNMSSQLPNILQFFSITYNSVEGKFEKLKVFCPVTGTPKPIITWKLDKVNISPNPRYSIVNGVLIIQNPRVSDSQTHICEARNKAGSTGYIPIHVVIQPQLRNISSFYSVTYKSVERKYKKLKIYCPVTEGSSKSVIKWQLNKVNTSTNPRYSFADGALIITNPQVSDSQTHKCEARNKAGSSGYIPVHVTIQQLPNITSSSSLIFKGVEGKDQQLKIPCSATGSPKPTVTWKLNNVNITPNSKYSIVDGALIIHKPQLSDSHKYKCEARNDAGSTSATFQADIHQPPSIISNSLVIFKGVKGKDKQLKIPCVATGFPKPIITWKINNVKISPIKFESEVYLENHQFRRMYSKYSIIDGALIIHKPEVGDSDKYKCEAKNDVGSTHATFQAYIQQPPSIISSSSVIFKGVEGKDAQLKIPCLVTGSPKPTVTWKLHNVNISPNSKYSIIDGALIIHKPQISDSQKYKCEAQNEAGFTYATFQTVIQQPPSIITSSSVIFKAVEGKDKQLKILCVTAGSPKPTVTWKLNNVKISPNSKYSIVDGALIIHKPQVGDSQKYKCEAKNEAGSTYATFQSEIQQMPEVSGEANKIVVSGGSIQIECKVNKGAPKPTITWQFKSKTNSNFVLTPGSENVLRILKVNANHTGIYKCIAHNIVGDSTHLTTLTVGFAPIIISNNSTIYKGIEGDKALRLPCTAIGVPQPVITWKADGVKIIPNGHYTIADGVLVIKDPKINDSKLYTCEVKNYLGVVQTSYKAEIYPNIIPFFSVTYNSVEGKYKNLRIFCPVTGTPKPIITWQLDKVSVSTNPRYSFADGALIINNPRVSDSQTHLCEAKNEAGSTGYITVHVVIKPQLQNVKSFFSVTYKSIEGKYKNMMIFCPVASGTPKPIIKWKLDKVNISPNPRYSLANDSLIIHNPQVSDSQTHKCEVKNKAGSSTYITVHVVIQLPPSITSSSSVIFKSVEGKDKQLKIPCVTTGSPKPIIRWKINNVNIFPNSKYSIIDGALIIHKPQVGDSQKYKCEAENEAGSTYAIFQVDVQQPPSIIASSSVILESVEGKDEQLKIPCVATGSPKPTIAWKLNNVNITPNSKYSIIDGALIIHKPQVNDSQKYKCVAVNEAGSTYATFQTDIQQPPSIISSSLVIFKSVEGKDEQLKIPCVTTGSPKPIITWRVNNTTVSPNSKYSIIDGALIIHKPQVGDSQKYKCEAKNEAGSTFAIFQTNVYQPPSIISSSSMMLKSVEGKDEQLKIPCVATGSPKPTITWKLNNVDISPNSKYSIVDGALIIHEPQVGNSHKYQCEARNEAGSTYATFQVNIQQPPSIISSSLVIFKSVEGKDEQLKIPCVASGSPKPIITWRVNNTTVSPNSKYSIIDGALIIHKPQVGDSQKYKCEAKNEAGSTFAIFQTNVHQPPNIISSSSVILKGVEGKDEQLKIPCVATGSPKPIVTWKLNNVDISSNSKYSIVDGALIIHKPQVGDSHKYQCEARNEAGSTYATFQANIQQPPSIISSSLVIFKSVEGKDEQLKIPCVATGSPKPIITWKVDNATLSPNSKYSIIDGALIIHKPQVGDSQKYKCEAKNEAGSTYAIFQTNVYQPPSIISSSSMMLKSVEGKDEQLKIPCVATGSPKPTITWKLNNVDISSNCKYSIVDGALIIHKPQVGDSHKYQCEARNEAGSTYATFQANIQQRPSIISSSLVIFKSVEGKDTQLKIPCVATGSPKPIITWKIYNTTVSPNSKYSIIDGALIIHKPQVGDSQKYKCEAKNEAGSAFAIFQTNVYQSPSIISSSSVILKGVEGKDEQLKIPCVATGSPKPTITWKLNNADISSNSKYSIADGALIIHKPQVRDSNKYQCEARNVAGSTYATFQVNIQQSPSIISSSSVIFRSVEGKEEHLKIPCVASGSPKPTITWKLNNENITPNSKYSIVDGALIIHKPQEVDSQKYKCEAKNEAGSTYVVFQTDIQQPPSIISNTSVILKSVEGKDEQLKIPCVATGSPKPIITWRIDNVTVSQNSKYSIIDGTLIIHKPQVGDSQKYYCEAKNDVGSTFATFQTDIQQSPSIISRSSDILKSVEGKHTQMKIPCTATGSPKPIITWKLNNVNISPNLKYSIVDGALIIHKPQGNDSQIYQCEAKNDAGSTYATFKTEIYQMPEILGETDKTVISGGSAEIECKVIKGAPNSSITWQFKSEINSDFVSIPGSENVFLISKVDAHHADKPVITSNNSTVYKGIEGDIALSVPCTAIGVPQPVITWKADGVIITSNKHYTIADGVLVIINPKKSDSKIYTCEAKNYLGLVEASYTAEVSKFVDDFGITQEVNILQGATTRLECGSTDPSQSIRWFIEGHDLGIKGKYYNLKNADVSLDGNYTCRISDMNGAQTRTYVVVIGYPPTFSFEQDSIVDWNGREDEELICEVEAKPAADIVWKFEGKVLADQKSSTLTVPGNWGHYTCDVSNIHGSVHRSFEVQSSDCLISRKPRVINMPLILTSESTWPVLDSTTNYLQVKSGQTILFSCPNHGDSKNTLKMFPKMNEISATCDKQDVFIVQDKQYKVLDFECNHEIDAVVIQKPDPCLTKNSKLMRVGYEVREFLETYEVCFDNSTNIPLYTRVIMSKSNLGRHSIGNWYKYPGIIDTINDNKTYACKDSNSRCCYSKIQLVNARDFSDGPAQKSTFIDPLNAIPYWRPCDINMTSPWDDIEDTVRSRLNVYDEFVTWSGTHMVQKTNGGSVPRYLWKVLRFDEEDAIAIIYVNGPSPSEADILCTNTCAYENSVPWIYVYNKYTYCCDLNDFLEAFNLHSTSIGGLFIKNGSLIEGSTALMVNVQKY